MCRNFFAISALLMAVSPALSQPTSKASNHVSSLVMNGLEVLAVQQRVINEFFRKAPSGKLTLATAATFVQREEAKKRQDTLSKILRNDLNGDGEVSAGEVDRVREVLLGHERVAFENMVLEVDSDNDGTLSGKEIATRVDKEISEMRETAGRRGLQTAAFLEFDINGDGVVDVDELKTSIRGIAEGANQRKERHSLNYTGDPKQRNPGRTCKLPAPSAGALPVYIGGGRGVSVSTVAIDGLDKETGFATLEIEKGSQPLYIVSSLDGSTVFRVTGATERVERFVGGGHKGIGVIGLPHDVVAFVPSADCDIPSAGQPDTMKWSRANSVLTYALDRNVQMIGDYSYGRLRVPSGQNARQKATHGRYNPLVIRKGKQRFRMTENGFETTDQSESVNEEEPTEIKALIRDLLHAYPGGIEILAPKDVLTRGKAEEYDVLPNEAGLVQLLKSGALSKLKDRSYSINKPFARFPAGISGLKFILRPGVPMPAGELVHGGIFIEETGECRGRC
jgi:Ca2+-binding EF-hand superfamily protein